MTGNWHRRKWSAAYILPDQPGQYFPRLGDDGIWIQNPRLEDGLSAECQELTGQSSGSLTGVPDCVDRLMGRIGFAHLHEQEFAVNPNQIYYDTSC